MRVSGLDATYYVAKDIKAMTKFYTDLLGQPPTASQDQFSEWVFDDGGAFGLYHMPDGGSPGGSAMFAVDDVAAAIAENKKRGVKFHDENVTDTPMCQMGFGEDPEGNQFILHKRKA